jgi:hypothetical protein
MRKNKVHNTTNRKKLQKFFSGLCSVVWWFETDILEAMLSPSSELQCIIKEMYPSHWCLLREVLDVRSEVLTVTKIKVIVFQVVAPRIQP